MTSNGCHTTAIRKLSDEKNNWIGSIVIGYIHDFDENEVDVELVEKCLDLVRQQSSIYYQNLKQNNMLSEIKSYLSKLAVTIIIGLAAFCFYQSKKIQVLDERLGQVTNNYEYYQSLTSRLRDDNRTLQLKMVDLNNSMIVYSRLPRKCRKN